MRRARAPRSGEASRVIETRARCGTGEEIETLDGDAAWLRRHAEAAKDLAAHELETFRELLERHRLALENVRQQRDHRAAHLAFELLRLVDLLALQHLDEKLGALHA